MSGIPGMVAIGAVVAAAIAAGFVFVISEYGSSPKLDFAPLSADQLKAQVQDKAFLIVGGTKGIGAALSKSLLKRGAKVTIVGRSRSSKETPEDADFVKADLSSMRAAKELVTSQLKGRVFDTVVFTNGIFARPELTRTSEGLEEDLAVSYLSRFVIINELLKSNALQGRKRVYVMGYPGQKDLKPHDVNDINFDNDPSKYSILPAHFNTVVFNEVLVHQLAKRNPDIHVFGLNPGIIQTGIRDNFYGGAGSILRQLMETIVAWTMPTAEQYSEGTLIPLMAATELDLKTSMCFSKKGETLELPVFFQDKTNEMKVWEASQALVSRVLPDTAAY